MANSGRIKQFEDCLELRFSKVRYRSKRPIEKDWVNKPYTYEQIQPHIARHQNYGVLCGRGDLAVADADSPELEDRIEAKLPPTFTVQTGSGGKHYYYFCSGIRKRIVLEDGEKHLGEIQSRGQQVVGPNSIHPTGRRYVVHRDLPISNVSMEDLLANLRTFMRRKKRDVSYTVAPGPYNNLNSIPILRVIDASGFRRAHNGELYGANPWHGSTTGANTWINIEKNVAYCFRHNCGIGVAKAIALNEGLVGTCSDALGKEGFAAVYEIAERKYGVRSLG